mgnify:CR=1 FL=1
MLNKLVIFFSILSFLSCNEQKTEINGTWVYIGWETSEKKGVMSAGFVDQEKYWEFSNSEISISDKTFKKVGTMEYKCHGDTILIKNRIKYIYKVKNDTLKMKELFSKSNVWRILIRN